MSDFCCDVKKVKTADGLIEFCPNCKRVSKIITEPGHLTENQKAAAQVDGLCKLGEALLEGLKRLREPIEGGE